jgi:mannose-6-phosphate isomerase-like protein (cupin superfamily)
MKEQINLNQKLQLFADYYAPRTIAEFNRHDVMLTKLKGPFIWHKHDDTDDLFLVLRGTLDIELPRSHRHAGARGNVSGAERSSTSPSCSRRGTRATD